MANSLADKVEQWYIRPTKTQFLVFFVMYLTGISLMLFSMTNSFRDFSYQPRNLMAYALILYATVTIFRQYSRYSKAKTSNGE